jgi:hypothetical protein
MCWKTDIMFIFQRFIAADTIQTEICYVFSYSYIIHNTKD